MRRRPTMAALLLAACTSPTPSEPTDTTVSPRTDTGVADGAGTGGDADEPDTTAPEDGYTGDTSGPMTDVGGGDLDSASPDVVDPDVVDPDVVDTDVSVDTDQPDVELPDTTEPDTAVPDAGPTEPGETVITEAPAAYTNADVVVVAFESNREGDTYECQVDGADFAPCTSPAEFTDLDEGAHTVRVRSVDTSNVVDPTPAEAAFVVDRTAPTPGVVSDGTSGDVDFLPAGTVRANWTDFADSSGVANYHVVVSETADCSADVVAEGTVSTPPFEKSAVVASGTTLYACVTAVDLAGNTSAAAHSDGATVDSDAPEIAITTPAPGAKLTATATLTGTASDALSGLASVEVSVRRTSDGYWWNGATFGMSEAWLSPMGQASWTLPGPTVAHGQTYSVGARALDEAGNVALATPTSFTVDLLAPSFAGAVHIEFASATSVTLGWNPASDTVTAPSGITYELCASDTADVCTTDFTAETVTAPGESSGEVPVPEQTPGSVVYATVRARDEAGNRDANTAVVSLAHATLSLAYTGPGYALEIASTPFDEFLRFTDVVDFRLPISELWFALYPDSFELPADDRLKQLQATLHVELIGAPAGADTTEVAILQWTGTGYELRGEFGGVFLGGGVDTIVLGLTLTDLGNPSASLTINAADVAPIPVFGGDPTQKSLLLDNDGGTLRSRVIERTGLVDATTLTLGVSDWRADQIVDKSALNLQIGTAMFSGRFGPYEGPLFGKLVYEVAVGYTVAGDSAWQPEMVLEANTASRFLGPYRTAYEGALPLPKGTKALALYLHVKATLVADYSTTPTVTNKYFADGELIPLKDAYDTPNGAFTNYEFPVK